MSSKKKKLKLWARNQHCFVCTERINHFSEATLEHIIPISRGGSGKLENLALSHAVCNQLKADETDPQIWQEKIRSIHLNRNLIIWKKKRSDYELRLILDTCFRDLSWLTVMTSSSLRFSIPHIYSGHEINLISKAVSQLREDTTHDLIEKSKILVPNQIPAYWWIIFGVIFIDHHLKDMDPLDILHAIWRINQALKKCKNPAFFNLTWDLLQFCHNQSPEAYSKMQEYFRSQR